MAEKLAAGRDPQWIRSVISLLDRKLQRSPLERLVTLWNLTGSEAGQLFNVSRQAFDKWLKAGAPTERALAIADLTDATDLLERYVKRERIPVVVRRPSPLTGNKSLIDLASAGKHDKVLAAVKQMFDLRRGQP